jgi:hypothetical protein
MTNAKQNKLLTLCSVIDQPSFYQLFNNRFMFTINEHQDTGGTRQTMYVQRKIEARLRNHCCSGKAIIITYSECVSVALVIQHAICIFSAPY